jgi:hypothetical protein
MLKDEKSICTTYAESVVQSFQGIEPLAIPFLGSIAPPASPFAIAPWVPDLQEAFAAEFNSADQRI